ncbi:MAG: SpoIIE family protein phosphatase [Actinobacteria bacterium]|nr:SpoIIE family protein phosphatase [Actinomycetota bacterium]
MVSSDTFRSKVSALAERRLRLAFVALGVALVVVVAAGVWTARTVANDAQRRFVGEAIPVRVAVQDLVIEMLNQQTAIRGFIITENPAFLTSFESGRMAAARDLAAVRANAGRVPGLALSADRAARQISSLDRYFAEQVDAVSRGGVGVTLAEARLGEGKRLFDAFRSTATLMTDQTQRFVADADRAHFRRTNILTAALVALGALALALVGVLGALVPRRSGLLIARIDASRRVIQLAADRTQALAELVTRLSAVASAAEVSSLMTDVGVPLLGAAHGGVFVVSDDRELLVLASASDRPERVLAPWRRVPITANDPVGDVARNGDACFLGSPEAIDRAYPHLAALRTEWGDAAWASLPLRHAGETIGVLVMAFGEPTDFDDDMRAHCREVAVRVAEALVRARLFDAERLARLAARDAQRRLRLLSDVGAILIDSSSRGGLLAKVADRVVSDFADGCFVSLGGSVDDLTLATVRHRDPDSAAAIRNIREMYPPATSGEHPARRAMRDERGVLLTRMTEQTFRAIAGSDDHLERLVALNTHSFIAAPLASNRGAIGVVEVVRASDGIVDPFDDDDRFAVEEVGRRLGLALEYQRLVAHEHHVAETLQRSLLPERLPDVVGAELGALYLASGTGNQVGGDFYDVFDTPQGGFAAVLGDVCGKGPEAAAVTALCRHTVRALAMREREGRPSRILAHLNRALLRRDSNDVQFATAIYARLDPRPDGLDVAIARAGHPPALVVRESGTIESYQVVGGLLGVVPDMHFGEEAVRLFDGDTLVLHTDGVTEARRGNQFFGEERLRGILSETAGQTPDAIVTRIRTAIEQFQRGVLRDDVGILVIRSVVDAAAPRLDPGRLPASAMGVDPQPRS